MPGKFISFEDVEQLATIEQLAQMLNLETHPSGRQLRCACPIHGGDERSLAITPDVRSKRGSLGVFFCQSAKTGGDRIGLVAHCMDIGQQDAAFFIAEQFGNLANSTVTSTSNSTVKSKERATVPPAREKAVTKREPTRSAFDPDKFWNTCSYSQELADAGISEDDAARVLIGWHARYKAHYIGSRNPDGSIAGFTKVDLHSVKFPPQWIEPQSKVLPFPKRA